MKHLWWGVIGGAGLGLFALLIPQARPDYEQSFLLAARGFFEGAFHPYDTQYVSFYNAPWMLFGLWPLTLLPLGVSVLVWRALNVLGVYLALQVFAAHTHFWVRVLALVNVHVFILLIVGNVDGVILLGVALSWWASQRHHPWRLSLGLWILSLKPQNVVLAMLVILWSLRGWTWPERLRAILPVFISVVSSPLIFGWDWPMRYWANLQAAPPWPPLVTTIWRALEKLSVPMPVGWLGASCALVALGWVLWHYGSTQLVLIVALTTNVMLAIYAIEPHYVLLLPAFFCVSERLPATAALAYLAGLGVFSLRAIFGLEYVWLAIVYPLILFVAMWFIVRADSKISPSLALQKT